MPQPTANAGRPDAIMTQVAVAYTNKHYIGDRAAQVVVVENKSDKYYVFQRGAWFRDEAKVRAPGSRAHRGGYTLTTGAYNCINKAVAKAVTDEERMNNLQAVLQPDIRATEWCANAMKLHQERLVASTFMTAANWASGHTEDAEGLWAAGSGNTFILDMYARIDTIRQAIGVAPNVLIINAKTLSSLQQEATLLDRIKYVQKAIYVEDLIASLFKLDELLVGDAIYSDADEKADGTDFNAVDVWETNATKGSACLYYRPPAPALEEPATVYRFVWGIPYGTQRFREEAEHQDVIEVEMAVDVKMVSNVSGFLWTDTHLT